MTTHQERPHAGFISYLFLPSVLLWLLAPLLLQGPLSGRALLAVLLGVVLRRCAARAAWLSAGSSLLAMRAPSPEGLMLLELLGVYGLALAFSLALLKR